MRAKAIDFSAFAPIVLAVLLVALALREAPAHDIYQGWHPPNNPFTSCCNDADCRPTQARVDLNGEWEAWNGQAWLPVPWGRVLPPNFAGDGRSHICEKGGHIYCFTPGEIRG